LATSSSVERISLLARAKHLETWQGHWREDLAARVVNRLMEALK
jgi:hypothetical protein